MAALPRARNGSRRPRRSRACGSPAAGGGARRQPQPARLRQWGHGTRVRADPCLGQPGDPVRPAGHDPAQPGRRGVRRSGEPGGAAAGRVLERGGARHQRHRHGDRDRSPHRGARRRALPRPQRLPVLHGRADPRSARRARRRARRVLRAAHAPAPLARTGTLVRAADREAPLRGRVRQPHPGRLPRAPGVRRQPAGRPGGGDAGGAPGRCQHDRARMDRASRRVRGWGLVRGAVPPGARKGGRPGDELERRADPAGTARWFRDPRSAALAAPALHRLRLGPGRGGHAHVCRGTQPGGGRLRTPGVGAGACVGAARADHAPRSRHRGRGYRAGGRSCAAHPGQGHSAADPGRVGRGQGALRPGLPQQRAARRQDLRRAQLRRGAGDPDRVGALRLRRRRLHRRAQGRRARQDPAGQRWHALPRRDRRHAARHAGAPAARAAGALRDAGGLGQVHPGRHLAGVRDPPRAARCGSAASFARTSTTGSTASP